MTAITKTLLAHLRQHIGTDPAKRKALLEHCNAHLPEPMHRGTLHKYIHGQQEPRTDTAICIMRWMQLEGVIKPGAKSVGLFIYTKPLKLEKTRKKAGAVAKIRRPILF